jgi:DNA-binding GntR family transcriptional regulator
MIVNRKLLPGDKIPQEKLAQDLGISRTPLVSALKYLEKEKLVEAIPRRGFYVRLFSKKEMISIFELREVLEGLAARRAARNISDVQINTLLNFFKQFKGLTDITDISAYAKEDRRFHNFISEIGAKEFLKSILENYNIISYSYQLVTSEGLVRTPNETIYEHLAMIDAISNKNEDLAEDIMREHLKKGIAVLRQELEREKQTVLKIA